MRGEDCRTFSETSKTVCAKFLSYWDAHGGLMQQGYPISGEIQERSDIDGKVYTVQYFERAVFELHPENQPPYDVLLSLLGRLFYNQRYPGDPQGMLQDATADDMPGPQQLFPETGKTASGVFLKYWQEHGGLAQQGYPISNLIYESETKTTPAYLVQYFERAVFEWHPTNSPPYDVLLSRLGAIRFSMKYPQGEPVISSTATPSTISDAWAALEQRPLNLPVIPPGSQCPVKSGKVVSPDFGLATGDGPVYAVGFGEQGTVDYSQSVQEGGWYYVKVLWVGDPSYSGPVLVRGHEIDGPNELRFSDSPNPASELKLSTDEGNPTSSGWNNWPTNARLRAPGCYAYQVDGTSFSEVIVFKAVGP